MSARFVIRVSTFADRTNFTEVRGLVIRPDVMYTWLPASVLADLNVVPYKFVTFQRANGETFERPCVGVIVTLAGRSAADEVIIAQEDDAIGIGWRTLAGLNLRFDDATETFVDRGPIPAAASQRMVVSASD